MIVLLEPIEPPALTQDFEKRKGKGKEAEIRGQEKRKSSGGDTHFAKTNHFPLLGFRCFKDKVTAVTSSS